MIPKIDNALKEWVNLVLEQVPVSFDPPASMGEAGGVSLYLFQVETVPNPRSSRDEPPLRAALHYLVTTWAKQPQDMHRMLSQLLFAAMDDPQWEVGSAAPPVAVWQSLGVPARPGFWLKAFAQKPRPRKAVPRVTQRLEIYQSPMRPLQGLLLGPERTPIMGAMVEVPSLKLAATTDYEGRFRFAAVPSVPPLSKLRVNVKGRALEFSSLRLPENDEPLILELSQQHLETTN